MKRIVTSIILLTTIILITGSISDSGYQSNTTEDPVVINGVSVPEDYLFFTPSINDETDDGKIFISNYKGDSHYFMILENDGSPLFYRKENYRSLDFKVQLPGLLSRFSETDTTFILMNSSYNDVDTFIVSEDYITDFHDFIITPDSTALMIGRFNRNVDMSQIVDSGSTNAVIFDYVIQELDQDHSVVFEWRAADHFDITGAYNEDMSSDYIDYVHINSVALDFDGHLLISSRNLHECTKINRDTGEIIWRLGGINNQFQFVNEDTEFNYQHDFQPVPGKPGSYTIFDNGDRYRRFSRVVEYAIDTSAMTSEKVWEYRHEPDYYAPSMGNAQRLPNGNTFINWNNSDNPKAMEVTPEREVVYKGDFEARMRVYRTFRFNWDGAADRPYLILEQGRNNVRLIFNTFGRNDIAYYNIYGGDNDSSANIIAASDVPWHDISIEELPTVSRYYIKVTSVDTLGVESDYSNNEIIFGEDDGNLIVNGEFSSGDLHWDLELYNNANAVAETGQELYHAAISDGGSSQSDIILSQANIRMVENKVYTLELDVRADADKFIDIKFYNSQTPWIDYGKIGAAHISTSLEKLIYTFQMTDNSDENVTLAFNIGGNDSDIYFDNIVLTEQNIINIDMAESNNPANFQLSQNYPNPFNPRTVIEYSIPTVEPNSVWLNRHERFGESLFNVKLIIYDLLGCEVATLVDEHQRPGIYKIYFDASSLSSGIYFYKLTAGKYSDTKKMLMIK